MSASLGNLMTSIDGQHVSLSLRCGVWQECGEMPVAVRFNPSARLSLYALEVKLVSVLVAALSPR